MTYRVLFLRCALVVAGTVVALLCRCIERKNPWDPVNGCPEAIVSEVRIESSYELKRYADQALRIGSTIGRYAAYLDSLKELNDSLLLLVNNKKNSADSVQRLNEWIDSVNTTNDCKNLVYKTTVGLIPYLLIPSSLFESEAIRDSLVRDSSTVDSIIVNANAQCAPDDVYMTHYHDSIMLHYSSLIRSARLFVDESNRFNEFVAEANSGNIRHLNERYMANNTAIQSYNDSIDKVIYYCEKPWVSDPVKIKDTLEALKAGDTLYIDSGSLVSEFRLYNQGDSTRPIVIEGSPLMNTVLENANAYVDGCENVIIRNIVFSWGAHQNISIHNRSKGIIFENCHFVHSLGSGIVIAESEVSLNNCIVADNAGHGIKCINPDAKLIARNVLIVRNDSSGIFSEVSEVRITNGTISDNEGAGIYLLNQKRSVLIINTLLTYNGTFGFVRQRIEDLNRSEFYNSCFFLNTQGDYSADDSGKIVIDSSCVNADPVYTNKGANGYTIGASSVLDKNWGYKP